MHALAPCAAVIVIVDVLSFSTAVDIAVSRGAQVYPFAFDHPEAARQAAFRLGAALASHRDAPGSSYSLSPASLQTIPAGTRLLLPSPNGSRLALAAGRASRKIPILAGCLRNARAVARTACALAGSDPIALIPAGETWPDGSLRPAIEDLLGAGAIIHHLERTPTPEAQIARDAYRNAGADIDHLVRLSVSGRELTDRGFSGDVDLALQENVSDTAPLLHDDAFAS